MQFAESTVFEGKSIGSTDEIISEIVFNTSMTGYLEILTDPSYAGQSVCMTYPLIGNYGVCREDMEAGRPHGVALATLLNNIKKAPLSELWAGSIHKNCAVTEVEIKDGEMQILSENQVYYEDEPQIWIFDRGFPSSVITLSHSFN